MVLNLQISQIPKNENLEFIHYLYYYLLLSVCPSFPEIILSKRRGKGGEKNSGTDHFVLLASESLSSPDGIIFWRNQ